MENVEKQLNVIFDNINWKAQFDYLPKIIPNTKVVKKMGKRVKITTNKKKKVVIDYITIPLVDDKLKEVHSVLLEYGIAPTTIQMGLSPLSQIILSHTQAVIFCNRIKPIKWKEVNIVCQKIYDKLKKDNNLLIKDFNQLLKLIPSIIVHKQSLNLPPNFDPNKQSNTQWMKPYEKGFYK